MHYSFGALLPPPHSQANQPQAAGRERVRGGGAGGREGAEDEARDCSDTHGDGEMHGLVSCLPLPKRVIPCVSMCVNIYIYVYIYVAIDVEDAYNTVNTHKPICAHAHTHKLTNA